MAKAWREGRSVAWTESDGPGRIPPAPSRLAGGAAAVALGVALIGMLSSDTVCPDHALWINIVGAVTLVLGITAIVATVKASATGVVLSLVAAAGGVAIAAIDVAHAVTGSHLALVAFAAAALLSAAGGVTMVRLRTWERTVLTDALAPFDDAMAGLPPVEEPSPTRADEVDRIS